MQLPGPERIDVVGAVEPSSKFLPASVGSALHFLLHQRDSTLAKPFFSRLRDGLELTAADPLHTLRERLDRGTHATPQTAAVGHGPVDCQVLERLAESRASS